MHCTGCGFVNPPGAVACGQCGVPMAMMYARPPHTSGMAIAGFVLAFFCSLLGLIFSIIALSNIKSSNGQQTGEGLAIAGIIISAVSFVIGIIWVIAIRAVAESASAY